MQNKISFEEVKQLTLKAIDESDTVSDILEKLIQKVYQKGYTTGLKDGIRLTEEYHKIYSDAGYDFKNCVNLF